MPLFRWFLAVPRRNSTWKGHLPNQLKICDASRLDVTINFFGKCLQNKEEASLTGSISFFILRFCLLNSASHDSPVSIHHNLILTQRLTKSEETKKKEKNFEARRFPRRLLSRTTASMPQLAAQVPPTVESFASRSLAALESFFFFFSFWCSSVMLSTAPELVRRLG